MIFRGTTRIRLTAHSTPVTERPGESYWQFRPQLAGERSNASQRTASSTPSSLSLP